MIERSTLGLWSVAGGAALLVVAAVVMAVMWPADPDHRVSRDPSSAPAVSDAPPPSAGDAALNQTMDQARRAIGTLTGESGAPAVVSPSPATPATAGDSSMPPAPRLDASGAPADTPDAPLFDIVRVDPRGRAVMAGRAAPGATVTILDGTRTIGRADADDRGQWVFLTDDPLPAGERRLSLLSRGGQLRGAATAEAGGAGLPGEEPHAESASLSAGSEGSSPLPIAATASPGGGARSALTVPVTMAAPVPVQAAPPRDHRPSARSGDATEHRSPTVVILSIPEADSGAPLLALETPRDAEGSSRLLQGPDAPVAEGLLKVGTVDYSAGGGLTLSGTARPGATVHLYLDNRPLARVEADSGGTWTATPRGGAIEARLYTLRADEVEGDGIVGRRVELPFQRADLDLRATAEGETMVVVQPGNNLWTVARTVYGEGTAYTTIYRANDAHIRDPDLIYPGQVFVIPRE